MKKIISLFALGVCLICANYAEATILTFERVSLEAGYVPWIPKTYGDNVSSLYDGVGEYAKGNGFTPDLVVAYTQYNDNGTMMEDRLNFHDTSSTDLAQFAYGAGTHMSEIFISSKNSQYDVRLNSFDLAMWPCRDSWLPLAHRVTIMDGNYNLLLDDVVIVFGGPNHVSLAPNIVSSSGIRIQFWDIWAFTNLGIDNIDFDQDPASPIPEPATMLLLGMGLPTCALFRRRN